MSERAVPATAARASSEEEKYKPRYTVSSLTGAILALLEPAFTRIFVEGEISGWRVSPAGHAYFTLKDSGAQISCVMFRYALERCRARGALKDGAKVLVCGKVSVYGPRGNYQLVVTAAKPLGEGDLMQRYLELKARLEGEGLFAAARKRRLPFLPRRIGIVTSEAGAVIHDMWNVLSRRFPDVSVRLYPSLVQGETAAASIVRGIAYFDALAADASAPWRPDVLIVARGGGSFEDLFCFNDERLVRAVAASRVPTVSAVGHETDFTLCDFAADVRAGTPSIAAELVVAEKAVLLRRIHESSDRLLGALRGRGEWFAQRLDHLGDALEASLERRVTHAEAALSRTDARLAPVLSMAAAGASSRAERARARLNPAVALALEKAVSRLEKTRVRLELLSPYGVLERGYSLTTDATGAVVRDAASLRKGDVIATRLACGTVTSVVASV